MKYLSTLIISEIPIYAFSQTASVIRYSGAEREQFGKADCLSGRGIANRNPFVFNSFIVNVPQKNANTGSKLQVPGRLPRTARLNLAANRLDNTSKTGCFYCSTALQNKANLWIGAAGLSDIAEYVRAGHPS